MKVAQKPMHAASRQRECELPRLRIEPDEIVFPKFLLSQEGSITHGMSAFVFRPSERLDLARAIWRVVARGEA